MVLLTGHSLLLMMWAWPESCGSGLGQQVLGSPRHWRGGAKERLGTRLSTGWISRDNSPVKYSTWSVVAFIHSFVVVAHDTAYLPLPPALLSWATNNTQELDNHVVNTRCTLTSCTSSKLCLENYVPFPAGMTSSTTTRASWGKSSYLSCLCCTHQPREPTTNVCTNCLSTSV